MPDPALSAAIREAYASAPVDLVVLHTLEIWHPAFTAPIRVVRDRVAIDARLEAGAPRNAAEVVTFTPWAFRVVPPEQISSGVPECRIEIDNVDPAILAELDLAVTEADPVTIIYRAYLSGDLDSGPETDPPMELTVSRISATATRIIATAGFGDALNKRFPGLSYSLEDWPGLLT